MELVLLLPVQPRRSQLHLAGSLACKGLCLCGGVLCRFSQRYSSRLQPFRLRTWKVLVWSEARNAEGEKEILTNFSILSMRQVCMLATSPGRSPIQICCPRRTTSFSDG